MDKDINKIKDGLSVHFANHKVGALCSGSNITEQNPRPILSAFKLITNFPTTSKPFEVIHVKR